MPSKSLLPPTCSWYLLKNSRTVKQSGPVSVSCLGSQVMVRQGMCCSGVTSAGPRRCCDCFLKKSRRDRWKKEQGGTAADSHLWILLLCVCLLTLWFITPGELVPRETGICLPCGWSVWLNSPPLQDDCAFASAEGLQGTSCVPKVR